MFGWGEGMTPPRRINPPQYGGYKLSNINIIVTIIKELWFRARGLGGLDPTPPESSSPAKGFAIIYQLLSLLVCAHGLREDMIPPESMPCCAGGSQLLSSLLGKYQFAPVDREMA